MRTFQLQIVAIIKTIQEKVILKDNRISDNIEMVYPKEDKSPHLVQCKQSVNENDLGR